MILGLHHVSAIASDAQANVDFYAGVLGLKLVKRTVNFDNPTGLHLYYGDETGSPGSLVTFFILPRLKPGREGPPQVRGLDLGVAVGSLRKWTRRMDRAKVENFTVMDEDDHVLFASDPDSLSIRLEAGHTTGASDQIHGFIGATLGVRDIERTADFIAEHFGWTKEPLQGLPEDEEILVGPKQGPGVVVHNRPREPDGRPGAGTVHHVAFRIGSEEELNELRAKLVEAGVEVSPVRDRVYFKSIYFREPGGILLEVATDGPGFAVDEPPESLGQRLCLPPWLEPRRAEIEAAVPTFTPPPRR